MLVNSGRYSNLLRNQLRRKRIMKEYFFWPDFAARQRPTSCSSSYRGTKSECKLEVLPHPPYHQIWHPTIFHLFWLLKDVLRRHHFRQDEAVKEVVNNCLVQQTCSPEKFMFLWDNGGGAQNELGTSMKINVTVLYFYIKPPYIIFPVVICMTLLLYVISLISSLRTQDTLFSL
jgi:hypothetical protein